MVDQSGRPGGLSSVTEPQGVSSLRASIPDALQIIWHRNPLLTTVALTEVGRKRLRSAVEREAREEYDGEDVAPEVVGQLADSYFKWAVRELEGGEHCGDCTCIPVTCTKCLAEDWLGISTIKGCGKHQLYKIRDAFRDGKASHSDIELAIQRLQNYSPAAEWDGWEAHAPRWQSEAKHALAWLVSYRDEHFPAADALPAESAAS